jgi:prepilin-type N-terminal cleavage/methylation domain-containing protein
MRHPIFYPINPKKGFTLVELMVASAVALLVLSGVFASLSQYQKTFHKKNIEQEVQQNVRSAMMFLQRDLRYAGSGLTMGFQDLDDWFGLDSSIRNIPWIISSGDGRDELIIAGITGEPVATLTSWVNEGGSQLSLTILDSTILPYYPKVGDVLLIASIEPVVVTSVISETEVQVSRDPLMLNTGLHLIYPAGTEVFQINVIRYSVADVEGVPTLLRDDSRFTFESNADRVVADGIELFEVTRSGNLVNIRLRGRSRNKVSGLTNDTIGDSLLRIELDSQNHLRNTTPALSIQGWPSDILYATNEVSGSSPTATPVPGVTVTPVPTADPGSTPTPQPTAAPQPTAQPQITPTAQPTVAPSPTPTPDDSPGNSGNAPGQVNRPKKK